MVWHCKVARFKDVELHYDLNGYAGHEKPGTRQKRTCLSAAELEGADEGMIKGGIDVKEDGFCVV